MMPLMRTDLPSGTVTLLFTDVEGSTKLLQELGEQGYAHALAEHRRLLREAFTRHGGVEVDTEGDAFFVAFPDPAEAVAAAREAQEALEDGPIRVRMGLHTGSPHLAEQGYVGVDVHLGARIAASAHGGQVVLSKATGALLDERFKPLDLGEHRVKDFAEPVWLYQLGTERFPPLKTISNTNLPRPASSFVGREREVAEIGALLQDGARLVTLTGPGGTGKTRLAIESAAELVPGFKNGVFWVPLAALRDPALVPDTISATIGAKDGLAEAIGEREMLLLVDNLEQIIAAAPELATLVEACPNLRLLATSRERLRVRGETEYPVPPLSDTEAVELFSERSRLVPDESVRALCRRLDDLPLAVELAAARTSVLTPAEILERLGKRLDLLKGGRDADPRQATLRATIEWSYELLDGDERSLFSRLSVFRGGWTVEAGEAICGADLDVLQSLLDKSLVRRPDHRFTMLETIREFASERLAASGEADEQRRRHADFFLALAEEATPRISSGDKAWVDRLEAEHDNLRAAFEQFLASGETESAQRFVGYLFDLWMIHGHFVEARAKAEQAVSAGVSPTAARAAALVTASAFADAAGDVERARSHAEEAMALYEALGDRRGVARARHELGGFAARGRDWAAARDMWQQCVADFTEVGDDHWALVARRSVAWASEELGDLARYRELVIENLEHSRRVGDRRIEARSIGSLAYWELKDGNLDAAMEHQMESSRIDRELANPLFLAVDLVRHAWILALRGDEEQAARLIGRSDQVWTDIGATPESWEEEEHDEVLEVVRARLHQDDLERALEEGRRLSLDEAFEVALGAAPTVTQAGSDPDAS
jgi:predicted ATPase/class 3 adenylate cyclase